MPAPLWNVKRLARVTGGKWVRRPPSGWSVERIMYAPGRAGVRDSLIVTVCSESWSGRADSAPKLVRWAKLGPAGAVIQHEQRHILRMLPETLPILQVPNTRKALKALAVDARSRYRGKVLALTGTVGKTSAREMLRLALDPQGGSTATVSNNNNLPGVQRTLASTHPDVSWSVIEMGFGNPRRGIEWSSLVAKPDLSLITNVSLAHVDALTVEESRDPIPAIARHKAKIWSAQDKGPVVLGADHGAFEPLASLAREGGHEVSSYGRSPDANARLISAEPVGEGMRVRAQLDGTDLEFQLGAPGEHMAINALGVLLCLARLGADVKAGAEALADYRSVRGRTRVDRVSLEGGDAWIIDDAFHATLASMRSSIAYASQKREAHGGRFLAVLGDISALANYAAEAHLELADVLEQSRCERVFVNGPLMTAMMEALPEAMRGGSFEDPTDMPAAVRAEMAPGDVVLVKSGRGTGGLGDKPFLRIAQALRASESETRAGQTKT